MTKFYITNNIANISVDSITKKLMQGDRIDKYENDVVREICCRSTVF
jgi:hypothetical protein